MSEYRGFSTPPPVTSVWSNVTSTVKACTKCGEVKVLGLYSRDSYRRDGRKSRCKLCDAAHGAAWKAANKERHRKSRAAWCAANKERHRKSRAAWYAANKERHRKSSAAWSAANKERRRGYDAARRARMHNADTSTPVDPSTIYARDEGICYLCGKHCPPDDWHLEHIQPLAHGGEHAPWNVAVSCPPCNLSKGARPWPNVAWEVAA